MDMRAELSQEVKIAQPLRCLASPRLISKNLILVLMSAWTLLVGASFGWNWFQIESSVFEMARVEALSHFEKDLLFRRWSSIHGGVYAPPTEDSPPNPYLTQIPDRDVVTTTGKVLTLINPAYMTRQVYELAEQQNGVRGHITSLNPLRPQNGPDEWEQKALSAFETGTKEIAEVNKLDGLSFLRFMRPLIVEKPCLLCHRKQGYEVGDIRGGISIAVPFAPYTKIAEGQIQHYLIGHVLFGIIGLIGIWVFFRRIEQTEDLLRASEFRFKFAIEGVGYGVWDWDIEQGVTHYSQRSMEMLGYTANDYPFSHQEWIATIRPEDQAVVEQAMQDYLNGQTPAYSIEYALKCKDGSFKWILSRGMAVSRDKTGRPLRVIGTHSDMTDRHALEEKIHELAFYDPLTQLPNRRLLNDRLDQALMASRRDERYGAVLFLDMDNFKPLNDTYGHKAGDLLLIEVAERLRKCVRATDTVARFGGDEFVVILNAVGEDKKEAASQAGNVAEKIRATLADTYRLQVSFNGQPETLIEHQSSSSIGVVLFKSRGAEHEDLLKSADTAMYAAKRAGRNSVRFKLDEGDL